MYDMSTVTVDQPGKSVLMMGNEAIARGAIEAGIDFCASYPGTPSTEITESLARAAEQFNIYVEWSTNEKVATEAAAAASLAGLRAIVAMKQNGVNVCADFLMSVNLAGMTRRRYRAPTNRTAGTSPGSRTSPSWSRRHSRKPKI
jgi:indolepyruvate ferredoxin oxidoreductase alpha subunit